MSEAFVTSSAHWWLYRSVEGSSFQRVQDAFITGPLGRLQSFSIDRGLSLAPEHRESGASPREWPSPACCSRRPPRGPGHSSPASAGSPGPHASCPHTAQCPRCGSGQGRGRECTVRAGGLGRGLEGAGPGAVKRGTLPPPLREFGPSPYYIRVQVGGSSEPGDPGARPLTERFPGVRLSACTSRTGCTGVGQESLSPGSLAPTGLCWIKACCLCLKIFNNLSLCTCK